jgi:hypothetical protein
MWLVQHYWLEHQDTLVETMGWVQDSKLSKYSGVPGRHCVLESGDLSTVRVIFISDHGNRHGNEIWELEGHWE